LAHAYKNFQTISHGDYLLENNAWREPDEQNPPQCIFGPPGALMGWNWHWPGSDHSKVVAFPEIIYGKKPFRSEDSATILPRRIDELKKLEADYAIHTPATGAYNTVFEMWITGSEASDQDSILAEVMVWVSNHGLNPAGRRIHSFNSPYGTAHLYEMDQRYLAFVLDKEMLAGKLDLLCFLRELQRLKLVSGERYVAGVEFGNEIAYGQGVSIIERYAVTAS